MQIHVKLFARARDLAGTGSMTMNVPEKCTVQEARQLLLAELPELAQIMPSLLMAVDGNYASEHFTLKDGCELACFPAVSGG
jgi:molybdopterin converting factor subunit 1